MKHKKNAKWIKEYEQVLKKLIKMEWEELTAE